MCASRVCTVGTDDVHHHRGTREEVQVHHDSSSRQTWKNTTLSRMRRSRMTAHSRVKDLCGNDDWGGERASGARPDGTERCPGTCLVDARNLTENVPRSEATEHTHGMQDITQSQMKRDTRHARSQAAASS